MSGVAACLLTFQRTEYAVRTVESVLARLRCPDMAWYVADDGSEGEHFFAIQEAIERAGGRIFGSHSERLGPGPNWNRAIRESLGAGRDVILWLEDDWELTRELDIEPYLELLEQRVDVGMVRMGYLAVGLDCRTVGHGGRHYLQMRRSTQYAYSGNPSLRHRRYFESYPWYPEKASVGPGDCEIAHDHEFRLRGEGPEIWWPVDLGGWSVWGHIGAERSY